MEPFRNRILDMYNELICSSNMIFRQTNNTIQQIEGGLREMLRAENNLNNLNNNNNTRIPLFTENIHPTTHDYNSSYSFPLNTLRQHNTRQPSTTRQPVNRHARTASQYYDNRPSTSSIWTPITTTRTTTTPNAYLFNNLFSNAFNAENLTPVIVRPTRIQIENATENIMTEDVSGNICPITQSPFQETDRILRIHHCGHCFMEDSLLSWFDRSVLCPVCRYDIREYIIPEHTSNISDEHRSNDQSTVSNNENNNNENSNMHDSEPNIENLVNTFTEQVTNTLRQYVTNNITNSNDDSGVINFEYVIQTPTNTYTTSSHPSNTTSSNLTNLFLNSISRNNPENNEVDDDVDHDTDDDVDDDWNNIE